MVDAMLGQKNDALAQAGRAIELLPISKDALNGARVSDYRAVTSALVGDKKQAIEQLAEAVSRPGGINYGELKLHPYFDSLRGTPEFEQLVSSLAPKE